MIDFLLQFPLLSALLALVGLAAVFGALLGFAAEYHMNDVAAEALGLTEAEIDDCRGDLFTATNTREDLGRLVAAIFGPRPCVNCPPGHDCERGEYATDIDLDVPPNAGSAS